MECVVMVIAHDVFHAIVRDSIEADNVQYFLKQRPAEQERTTRLSINSIYSVIEYAAYRNSTKVFLYLLSDRYAFKRQHVNALISANSMNKIFRSAFSNSNLEMVRRVFQVMHEYKMDVVTARYPKIRNDISCLYKHQSDDQSILYFLAKFCLNASPQFYDNFFALCKFYNMPMPTLVDKQLHLPPLWLDQQGNTPLHIAAKNSNYVGTKYFIERLRISPLRKNSAGETAFDLISRDEKNRNASPLREYMEVFKFFLDDTNQYYSEMPLDLVFLVTDYIENAVADQKELVEKKQLNRR